MRKGHHPPFQARVAGVAIITTVAVLAAACLSFMLQQWGVARQEARLSLNGLGDMVATAAAPDLATGDRGAAGLILTAAARENPLVDARLTDLQGRVVATYLAPRTPGKAPQHLTVAQRTVALDGRPVGTLTLRAAPPSLGALIPRFLALTGALFFSASGVALFLARGLAQRVTAPVERLSQAMAEVAASGEFTPVAENTDDDVFHRLTQSFNDLLAELGANHRELHRAMEELVEARDAADAANVAKSRFLANMSHEIRTPLNGVLAMAEVMARDSLDSTQRERLAVVQQSGEQLLSVLNDVLDLSKIEAGKLELATKDFDIEAIAASVREGFSAVAEAKALNFEIAVSEAAQGSWRGDGDRLRQILSNLVSNALKFTAEGSVSVAFELADAGGLRLSVADTGIGIAADKIPLLFEKFTQADTSTTRRYGGTGLGLAICRELAELMRGSITVISEEGKGSTFFAELPLERGSGTASPVASPLPPQEVDRRRVRLLAAEDNLVNQKVLKAIIEPTGVELAMVADGQSAVDAWRNESWDVILMDIQMPIMDGIAATRLIRLAEAAEQRPRTPILALTANALVHQIDEYIAAGMDGHVAKPIEIAKLYEAIDRAMAAAPADAKAAA
jgi:signal transduction histidine kinase/ActR/RegA family two-component response regulator